MLGDTGWWRAGGLRIIFYYTCWMFRCLFVLLYSECCSEATCTDLFLILYQLLWWYESYVLLCFTISTVVYVLLYFIYAMWVIRQFVWFIPTLTIVHGCLARSPAVFLLVYVRGSWAVVIVLLLFSIYFISITFHSLPLSILTSPWTTSICPC